MSKADNGRRSREYILSAVELFGADLPRGERHFEDGRVVRDVDALDFGIATTAEIETQRAKAKEMNHTEVLVRLAEILNNIGTIFSRHRRLRKWDGDNKPPFFYWGKAREEFDGRTPWWISANRRESYLSVTFLEEYGTVGNLVALLKSRKVSARIMKRFGHKTPLRVEIASRFDTAIAVFTCSEGIPTDDDDPVQDLPTAVQHPDHWCRPHVSLMLREAAMEGLEGPLAALYPRVMTDRLLHMLWQESFVPDALHDTLYQSGMTAAQLIARGSTDDAALRVNTGELNEVLAAAKRLTSGAG